MGRPREHSGPDPNQSVMVLLIVHDLAHSWMCCGFALDSFLRWMLTDSIQEEISQWNGWLATVYVKQSGETSFPLAECWIVIRRLLYAVCWRTAWKTCIRYVTLFLLLTYLEPCWFYSIIALSCKNIVFSGVFNCKYNFKSWLSGELDIIQRPCILTFCIITLLWWNRLGLVWALENAGLTLVLKSNQRIQRFPVIMDEVYMYLALWTLHSYSAISALLPRK